jgi:hypothetical protein
MGLEDRVAPGHDYMELRRQTIPQSASEYEGPVVRGAGWSNAGRSGAFHASPRFVASKSDIELRCKRMEKRLDDRDLYGGLIRLHVLHHANDEPMYGHWMIEELRRHGYHIEPGTMYPLLHGLEAKGCSR